MFHVIWILYILSTIQDVASQQVCTNDLWGHVDSSTINKKNNAASNEQSFVIADYPATCYGRVTRWRFYDSGVCHDVIVQVYRPIAGGGYLLVGENTVESPNTCLTGNIATYDVPTALQIPIQAGDLIGCMRTGGSMTRQYGDERSKVRSQNSISGSPLLYMKTCSTIHISTLKSQMKFCERTLECSSPYCRVMETCCTIHISALTSLAFEKKPLPGPTNYSRTSIIQTALDPQNFNGKYRPWKKEMRDVDNVGTTDHMFRYLEGLPGSNQYNQIYITDQHCTVGDTSCDWTSAKHVVRLYDLQTTLNPLGYPFIDNLDATILIAENQPAGLAVYHVICSSNRNYNPVVQPDFTYAIVGGNNNGMFAIDESGIVSTTGSLDYETRTSYSLNISVSQGPYISYETLTVLVDDVNEPHSIISLPTTEILDVTTINTGTRVHTIQVSHIDSTPGNWPTMVYRLVNTDPAADLFKMNGRDVEAKQNLQNWVGASVIIMYISATDYYFTTPPMQLTVVLNNMRVAPHLINLPNVVTLPEDAPQDKIFDVTAIADSRSSTGLVFEIKAIYPAQVAPPGRNPFNISTVRDTSINPNGYRGEVSYIPNPQFDYMTIQKYEVEIVVKDDMFDSIAENLTVEITWVNQPPYFEELNYGMATIPELSPIGTVIPDVVLQTDDRDIPLGDWIDYIVSNTGQSLFHASNITHKLYVIGDLVCAPGIDFVRHQLYISVYDASGAVDPNQPAIVSIGVTDINDHTPQFAQDNYEGSVLESNQGGTSILDLSVMDEDAGDNAKLSFIVQEEYARIYFEATTCSAGQTPCTTTLKLKQPISHIDYPNITFNLMVYDHGTPTLNDTTTIFVDIIDVNDHPPEFVQEYYNTETVSEMDVGSAVVQVEIYDPDTDINSNVTFVLLIPESGFNIDSYTGTVKSKKGLQAYKTHILYAYARDFATPELLSDPCVVRIDTFTAKHHLVDIHMELPLQEFLTMKEEFLRRLNLELFPWYAKQDRNLLYPHQSILTIYALSKQPSDSLDDLDEEKVFIDRNELMSALRVNIQGKPKDWLRGPKFAEYQVFKVVPTYPIWLIDTIGGIITLTLLCLLFICFWIILFCVIAKGWNRKAKVNPEVLYPDAEEYELRYGNYTHVPYPKEPNLHKKKKGVLPSPLVAQSIPFKDEPAKNDVSELPEYHKSGVPNKPLPPSGLNRNIKSSDTHT